LPYRTFALSEVAEYLHLSKADIEKLVRRNEIPFEHRGRQVVFRKNDIDAWASQRILGLTNKRLDEYHQTSSSKTGDLSQTRAIISALAKKNLITTSLASKTKPSLLRDITAFAEAGGLVSNPRDLLQSLEDREKMCSTAMPDGFALLHPRQHDPYLFEDSFIAFGRTNTPIPFGAPDGNETDLFFLICCQNDRLHLHVLARLCLMCRDKSFLISLRQAPDAPSVHECLKNRETEILKLVR